MNELYNDPVNDNLPPPKLDWVSRFLLWLAGADVKILLTQCPEDIPKILAQALLLIGTFVYSSVVLTLISNRLFAAGDFSFGLMLGSSGVSALIGAADSYVFLHCGWLKDGIVELKKVGWEIPLPAGQRLRMNLFLVNRFALALCWAQIIGLCLGLIVYESDVKTRIEANYLKANAAVVTEVSRPFDAEIKSQQESVGIQESVVRALARQSTALRQSEVDRIIHGYRKRRDEPMTDSRVRPFETRLEEEQEKLDTMKKRLADLMQGRNAAIRKAVDSATNHVPFSGGFLAQVKALDEIASENGKVAFLIIVLELVAVGIELSPILAKVLGLNPTAHSAIYAREYFIRLNRIADAMESALGNAPPPPPGAAGMPANNGRGLTGGPPPANDNLVPRQQAKRGRGRPRKYPPTNGSGRGFPGA
jgi:Domain of unknown function (DUF4407)